MMYEHGQFFKPDDHVPLSPKSDQQQISPHHYRCITTHTGLRI